MSQKTIAVIGDPLIDRFIHGTLKGCQDGCPAFQTGEPVTVPGGAANAAFSLRHTDARVILLGPVCDELYAMQEFADRIDLSMTTWAPGNPVKTRYLDDATGRIVFRQDVERDAHGLSRAEMDEARDELVKVVKALPQLDGLYIADYDKGWLDGALIRILVREAVARGVPVVVDPKRHPSCAAGAVLKCNAAYAQRYYEAATGLEAVVVTHGPRQPLVVGDDPFLPENAGKPVACVNHVGAGDCFGAHLTLALARGLPLPDAARHAHAAGRVYVQHLHNRAPWPHEVARDHDPVGGKILGTHGLASLRESEPGRIVFTNGCFRWPTPGHAWLLNWAQQQGDALVVGVNDDYSASRLRPGEFCLPLAERLALLAGLEAVDWVIPFTEDDPCAIIRHLSPDVLVKGPDYRGQRVPGDDLVTDVRFAPDSPYPEHCTDLLASRG